MLSISEQNGWEILNGNKTGDEEGNWTCIKSNGESVIDYGIVNEEAWEEIEEFKIADRVDSDHMPLEISIKGRTIDETKEQTRRIEKNNWNEEGIRKYREKVEKRTFQAQGIDNKVTELITAIKETTDKRKIVRREANTQRNNWWDKECCEKKKQVKEALKQYRKGEVTKQEYNERRQIFKKKCNDRKIQRKKEEENKIKNIKEEAQVWRYINRERKKTNANYTQQIELTDWRRYFMTLLEGTDTKSAVAQEDKEENDNQRTEEITRNDILQQIQNLKKSKAPGRDGIENEAWIYATEEVTDRLYDIMNDVWKGEGFPNQWREGIICPIYKKGNKKEISNYRGITLLNTMYKVYGSILAEKLTKEMEEKEVLPDGQAGFRRGRGAIDNIYILNYAADKELEKKGGKLFALFVDFKAAFDTIDRECLWECLRKKGISKNLIQRVKEIYKETKSKVRVGGEESEGFWTSKGLRQGCPLSPPLFAAYISDVDDMFQKAQTGGLVVGRKKIWTLAYADDLVLISKTEKEMTEMIRYMERYVKKKRMEVNVDKTKMLVFGNARGRRPQYNWRWEGREVEEVKELKYLGYMFNRGNTATAHIKEITKKANKIAGTIWSIGERKFGHDIKRRITMFDYLIKSVLMYGAEIWGWKEYEEIERVQEKYLRWILGVDMNTPGYIVREETKREKLRVEAGRRAVKFEDLMSVRPHCLLVQECWREKRKRAAPERRKDRQNYYERNGYACAKIEELREAGRWMNGELHMRDKDIDQQERRTKIKESRYNRSYERIITEELPKYEKRESAREKRMLARFRCGNEERENRYWMEEEKRVCRMCGEGRETIEHMLNECNELKPSEEKRENLLNEDGRGLWWMKNIYDMRKKTEDGRK